MQAAAYSGTFGTNGFHLFDFANESTVVTTKRNENDFTANNISTSAGAGNDVLFDVPTNGTQSDTGAGGEVSGNYATMNPLRRAFKEILTFFLMAIWLLTIHPVMHGPLPMEHLPLQVANVLELTWVALSALSVESVMNLLKSTITLQTL